MRRYEQVEIKRKEVRLVKEVCDCCNVIIERRKDDEFNDTAVFVSTGLSLPAIGYESKETLRLDLCVNCFKEKLIPAVEKELEVKFYITQKEPTHGA